MGLSSGQLLACRYRLDRRIAVGGMGEVWQAADTRLDRQVAVKVLKPELSGDAEFRRRFQTEARMTASLNHPGIAAVHDYGEAVNDPDSVDSGADTGADTGAYLVMELVHGEPLATILLRQQRLPADRTLDILEQASDALQAAHERGLVHRDIKPGNILITPAGRVKLTDFGIARAVDSAPVTSNGMVMGTAHYIAPEQAAGHEAGPPSDVYSLGVVGYECLAGQRPFAADNTVTVAMMHIRNRPPPLPTDVPAGARALIEAALAKEPQQRYRTGGEFATAVAAVRAGQRPPKPSRGAGPPPTAALTAALSPAALSPQPPMTAQLSPPSPLRSLQQRSAVRIAAGLLGVLVLVLGGYLAREALRSPAASPVVSGVDSGVDSDARPTDVVTAPTSPEAPQEPIDAEDLPISGVLVVPTDYWGESASDAAFLAKSRGLVPRVVDEDGDQVDRDRRSRCRVVGVRPLAGIVARGSTLELTCRRSG